MKKRTRIAAMAMALSVGAGMLTGCGSSSETPSTTPAAGTDTTTAAAAPAETVDLTQVPEKSITLTVMLPMGQWTDTFNQVIDGYMAEHPEIKEINATFPSSDKYQDLMMAALAAGDLPDVVYSSYGLAQKEWWQYQADLSTGCPAYDLLTDEQKTLGTIDGYGMLIMPIYTEGTGILYNMRLLEKAGWDHTPQTRDELLKLCQDLDAAGIKPFMHQWGETYLNLFSWVGSTWLGNKEDYGTETLNKLLAGEDVDLSQDEDWNDLLDTYQQVLMPYAQPGAISTDKWTCRNAFFLEECAMLVGEGSWETSNIENTNPDLLNYVKQDVLPISNTASKNRLQREEVCGAVIKNEDPVQEASAKDFLSFLVSSETARVWQQEVQGCPTAITTLKISEKLPALAQQVMELMKEDKTAEVSYIFMPRSISTDMEEAWSKFVGEQYSKDEFTQAYEKIFKDYASGMYD